MFHVDTSSSSARPGDAVNNACPSVPIVAPSSASCSVDTSSNDPLPLPEGLNYLPERAAFVVGNLGGDPNMGLSLFGMDGTLEKWVQPEGMVHTFGIQYSFDKTSLLVVNATLYGVRF
jgi:hypothetical protein